MIRTRVGYAGGRKPAPRYTDLGDHTETIQLDFDPRRIGYRQILAVFLDGHDVTARPWSRQYRSVVLYHDAEQRELALQALAAASRGGRRTVHTAVEPLRRFHRAEAYHQKHALRGVSALLRELQVYYPEADALTDSTAVARINGFLGGHGTRRRLDALLPRLGLSPAGEALLRRRVR